MKTESALVDIRVRSRIGQQELDEKMGKILTDSDINMLLTGPVLVRKPDGKPLCVYLPGVMTALFTNEVYSILHSLRTFKTDNRGLASGTLRVVRGTQNRARAMPVASAIIGSVDPGGVYKYCRQTAWTGKNLPQWQALQPLLQGVARHFQEHVPDRYEAQMQEVRATEPEWIVPETPFSTITVNNCVDPETQALSRTQGWVSYDKLAVGEEILAFDPETGTTRWEPLLDLFVNERYSGDMVQLSARGFSALTTPEHRWPLQAPNTSRGSKANLEMTVKLTKDLPGGYWSILRGAPHEAPGTPIHSDAFVRIAAWYFTEGTLLRAGTSVSICQSEKVNPHHVDAIRRDLKEMGAIPLEDWRTRTCSEGGCPEIAVSKGMCNRHACAVRNRERKAGTGPSDYQENRAGRSRRDGLVVNEYLQKPECEMVVWVLTGSGVQGLIDAVPGKAKVPTPEFLASLTIPQLQMFVETCIAGDGSPEWRRFYQYHPARMDAFVAAATLAGLAPALDSTGTHCFIRQPRSRNAGARISLRSVKREAVQYEGVIWCPSVPSSHWVAKRDGKVHITGNSYPTGCHVDKGDLEKGFSTIACLRRGDYTGGTLCFPEYRIGVNMKHGDLILMDAHEVHGNTAIVCQCGDTLSSNCDKCGAERISLVSYYRQKMSECESMEDELKKAVKVREKRK